jgi:hypothetical protein
MDQPRSNLRRSPGAWVGVVAFVIAAALTYATFRLTRPAGQPAPGGPPDAASPVGSQGSGDGSPSGTARSSVAAGDAARLLAECSGNSLFRRWLATGDLVHRWALVTVNIAEDASPRNALEFAAPQKRFAVVPVRNRLAISPESYARYDAIADLIDSVDARAIATAYRTLHPALEAAYRALGYPGGLLDHVTARALRRIEKTPVPKEVPTVEPRGGLFVFTDPRLERLGDVEKHLLRMGPRNQRLIQAKAREVVDALGFQTVAARAR